MSLSQAIIQNNTTALLQGLATGADVNLIDEYGFTPLIEAAIMNRLDFAELLVSHGADVKTADLTGGTPLHWAVENNNLPFVEFLLKQGADPNAYTAAGESTLVKPILRHQSDLLKMLTQANGDMHFAQDFINTKSLGHRFELVGQVDIVDSTGKFTEVDLEGFFLEFSLDVITRSLLEYMQNFAAKHLRKQFYFLQILIQAMGVAAQLIKYQQYQVDLREHASHINRLLTSNPIIIPVAFAGHATSFVRFGNFLAKCDRRNLTGFSDSIVIYEMEYPEHFDLNVMRYLLYARKEENVVEVELPERLGLKPISHLIIRKQISGNCSWANIEACVPVLLWMLSHDLSQKKLSIAEPQDSAIQFYHEWQTWDQDRELQFCIDSFQEASPARRASKAALLGAILFQRCSAKNAEDLQRAKKILKVLRTPGYQYVIESYLETYCGKHKTKAGENFQKLLEEAQWV